MQWPELILTGAISLYACFILSQFFVLAKLMKTIPQPGLPGESVTIIIPARNEECNIVSCLEGIAKQDFPKDRLKMIIVDDHSTERTADLVKEFIRNTSLSCDLISLAPGENGKKQAILKAVRQSTTPVILTRDADTFTNDPGWLKKMVSAFEKRDTQMVTGPVVMTGSGGFLSVFQQFENLAINALTCSMAQQGYPFSCSGANLAYKKDSFLSAKGYDDNMHIASGDDMFLLSAFYKKKLPVVFVNAPVYTRAETSVGGMCRQRLRWASKWSSINSLPVKLTGVLVMMANLCAFAAFCLAPIYSSYFTICLFTLLIKFLIDFLLLFLSARMFKQKVWWRWYPLAFGLNMAYTPIIACCSLFLKPQWKGRRS